MSIDDEPVTTLEDLRGDLAGRYKWTPSSGASVDPAIVEADMAAIDRDGYIIWENLLSADECRQIKETVEPWLVHPGRNAFEGRHTQRVYSLLSRTRICDRLVDHPRVLAVLDRILMDNYLLSALQAINIQPGESAQLAHHDDGFYPIPRPREPLAAATIWAIDDFTADNGATRVVPGSHRWSTADYTPDLPTVTVEMSAGSALFYRGTVLHGGGANRTDRPRLGVILEYVVGWLRPQENHLLAVPREVAATLPEAVQELLGYNVYPPFVGYVDGRHPRRSLQD